MPEKVLIIGTGWAGYTLTHNLDDKKFDITVVSPEPTTPYTPLLASAAVGLFNFSSAEEPIRHKNKTIHYVQARVDSIDFDKKTCRCSPAFSHLANRPFDLEYDRVIIAPGCTVQTFNTPGALENALFVRTVKDAIAVRTRLQDIAEMASLPHLSDKERRDLLHVIIVGGGPTGVEISAELTDIIEGDFEKLYPSLKGKWSVAIHDVADHLLPVFDAKLAEYAKESFLRSTVEIHTDSHITKVEPDVMHTKEEGAIAYGLLIWATGNKQVPLVDKLEVSKSERLPRILTDDQFKVLDPNGKPMTDVFAIGDAADIKDKSLPTTAEVACQKASHIAKCLNAGKDEPFKYNEKPAIAYTGQHQGVIQGQNDDWSGESAWFAWRAKSLDWAKSWRNRVQIVTNWGLNQAFGKENARK